MVMVVMYCYVAMYLGLLTKFNAEGKGNVKGTSNQSKVSITPPNPTLFPSRSHHLRLRLFVYSYHIIQNTIRAYVCSRCTRPNHWTQLHSPLEPQYSTIAFPKPLRFCIRLLFLSRLPLRTQILLLDLQVKLRQHGLRFAAVCRTLCR